MAPSEKNIEIVRFLRSISSPALRVTTVRDKATGQSLDVATMADFPEAGANTYSTVGMSDIVFNDEHGKPYDFRMEIVASDDGTIEVIPDILADVAFHARENPDWICTPGSSLQGIIGKWKNDTEMEHVYFTSSFFIDALNDLKVFDGTSVAWVMMIPISQEEFDYLQANGDEAFERMLEEQEVDFLDFDRESAI